MTLPDLGVGLIHQPGLEPLLEAGHDLLDVVEIEPQTYWFRTEDGFRAHEETMAALGALPHRKLVHGVGFPVGGTTPPSPAALEPFAGTVARLGAPWCSEHLSFNRVHDYDTLFLLPPIQSPESIAVAAANIRAVQALLPVPFAFETGVNYLRPRPGELGDGAFFAGIAEQADCGILLDLHNLWCNERNGRQRVLDAVAELPADRVWELHLAGGEELDGYWLDAHSGTVDDALLALAAEVVPALPNLHAIVFEMVPDRLTSGRVALPDLVAQLQRFRELWELRGRAVATRRRTVPAAADLPTPYEWEVALGEAVTGPDEPADPGVRVIRRVLDQARASRIVAELPYAFRLVVLAAGADRFAALLDGFRRTVRPELLAADEVVAFGAYLTGQAPDVPYLADVVALELARLRARATRVEQRVRLSADPLALLGALGAGRLPAAPAGDYDTLVPAG